MLTVIGDLIDDVVVLGAGALERGTDNAVSISHTRGGSAANVAAAAAALAPVRFIGRIGEDASGDALARALEAAGVDVKAQREGRTGSIVILVDDSGERTMLTDRAAAAELGPIDPAWLAGTTWLHLPLYGVAEPESRAAVVAAAGSLVGVPRSLDLSSVAALRDLGTAALNGIIDAIAPDVVFANADEAAFARESDVTLPQSTTLVVKRGDDPVLVIAGGTTTEVSVERVPDVVDTTGAGDAFAAGYLVAASHGSDPKACAQAGIALAVRALTRPGAL